MGCPDAIVRHLAGKRGIKSIKFNIESRGFEFAGEADISKKTIQELLNEVSQQENRNFVLEKYNSD